MSQLSAVVCSLDLQYDTSTDFPSSCLQTAVQILLKLPRLVKANTTQADANAVAFIQKLLTKHMDKCIHAQLLQAWIAACKQSQLTAWQSVLNMCNTSQVSGVPTFSSVCNVSL